MIDDQLVKRPNFLGWLAACAAKHTQMMHTLNGNIDREINIEANMEPEAEYAIKKFWDSSYITKFNDVPEITAVDKAKEYTHELYFCDGTDELHTFNTIAGTIHQLMLKASEAKRISDAIKQREESGLDDCRNTPEVSHMYGKIYQEVCKEMGPKPKSSFDLARAQREAEKLMQTPGRSAQLYSRQAFIILVRLYGWSYFLWNQ